MGEKGILILAPMIGRKYGRDSDHADVDAKDDKILYGFRATYVWNIRQTDGDRLPEIVEVCGDVSAYQERLIQFTEAVGIRLRYEENLSALGLSRGGEIVLRAGLEPAEAFATLVHENA
jgi:hypothetical protein